MNSRIHLGKDIGRLLLNTQPQKKSHRDNINILKYVFIHFLRLCLPVLFAAEPKVEGLGRHCEV